jgi:menaquinone-9 beta-reductase
MTQPTLAFQAAGVPIWDVLVVGAGPAGSLAARQLAARGVQVLIVDKKSFPRWKVCGACLNGPALGVLRSVGLGQLSADLGGIELDALELSLYGRVVRLALPGGVALSRRRLDTALVDAAIAVGAQFLPETQATVTATQAGVRKVQLVQHGRMITAAARVVLVAAGLGQTCLADDPVVQTRTAVRSRVGSGCVVGDYPDAYPEKTIFMAVGQGGYVGLVRLEDGSLNVAAAFDRGFLRSSGGPRAAASLVVAQAGLPPVPALRDAAWQGTVSLTRWTWPIAGERLFLLGDAAGYVEPFTGEGMAWALMSAQAIEPLAWQGIDGWHPSLASAWAALHWQLVGRRQRRCRGLAMVLRHLWLARPAFEVAARIPRMAELIIQRVNAPSVLSQPG